MHTSKKGIAVQGSLLPKTQMHDFIGRTLVSAGCALRQPNAREEAAIMHYYAERKVSPQQTAHERLAMNHLAVYDDCGFYQEGRWGTVIVSLNGWEIEMFAYDMRIHEVTLLQRYKRSNAMVDCIQHHLRRFINQLCWIYQHKFNLDGGKL